MVSTLPDPISQEPGAVARLVSSYMERRGQSKRGLALKLGTDTNRVRALMSGRSTRGTRYLGVRLVGDGDRPMLRRVADVLEIPDDELTQAVAFDLGIIGAVSSTPDPSRLSSAPAENGTVVPIEAARSARVRRLYVVAEPA